MMMRSEPISISPEMLDAVRQVAQEITLHSDQFEPSLIQSQRLQVSRQNLGAALEKLTISHLPVVPQASAANASPKKAAALSPKAEKPKLSTAAPSERNEPNVRALPPQAPQKKDPQANLLNALMEAGKRYRSSRLIKADRISDAELSRIRTEENSIPDALREELWDQL